MRGLLIALGFPVQYRVLRCAAKAGMSVSVLGNAEAKQLRFSRYCNSFELVPPHLENSPGTQLDAWADLLIGLIEKQGADILLPGDAQATLLLGQLRSRLEMRSNVRIFPVPTESAFLELNDKWAFYKNCLRLNLPVPKTWRFDSKEDAIRALATEEFPDRLVVKPLDLWGGYGVKLFDRKDAGFGIRGLDYEPLLIQEYIEGEDTGLSVLVRSGRIVASLIHQVRSRRFYFFHCEEFLRIGEALATDYNCDGILHIDAQMTPSGELYLLECNPRVYLSMDYAALAGINLIELGIRDSIPADAPPLTVGEITFRKPPELIKSVLKFKGFERNDLRAAAFQIADPVMFALETWRLVFKERTEVWLQARPTALEPAKN